MANPITSSILKCAALLAAFFISGAAFAYPGQVFFAQPNPSNFYVSPSGSDSNDCLASSASGKHGPCLTVQHTVNIATAGYDAQGANIVINLAAGTYSSGFLVDGPVRGLSGQATTRSIKIVGAGSGSTTLTDSSGNCGTIIASGSAQVLLTGLTISNSGCSGGGSDIFAQNSAWVGISTDTAFGAAGAQHIHVEANAVVEAVGDYSVVGSAPQHWGVSDGGRMLLDGHTITCSGSLAFSQWAFVQSNGTILALNGTTFSGCGSVTGERFSVQGNGIIDVDGGSLTLFPGDAAGQYTSGGRYIPEPQANLGTCTNGTITPSSTSDVIGVAFSGSNSNCTINFGLTKSSSAVCTASSTSSTPPAVTTTNAHVVVTGTFINGDHLYVLCQGNPS